MKHFEINQSNIVDFFIALKEHNAIVDVDGKEIRVILKVPLCFYSLVTPDCAHIEWERFENGNPKSRVIYYRENGKAVSYNKYHWKVSLTPELYSIIFDKLTNTLSDEEKEYLEEDSKLLNEFIYGKQQRDYFI